MKVPVETLNKLGMTRVILTDKQHEYFTKLVGEYFDVVTYLPLDVVFTQLESKKSHILNYILIEHNKVDDLYDINKKEFKKEHIHIVCSFLGRHRASSLVNMFNTTEVMRLETTPQIKGSVKYLTHETTKAIAQGKVKYENSKLISNNFDFWENICKNASQSTNTALQIIDMILLGIPHREMVAMFGRDYVLNFSKYKEMAGFINDEETIKINKNNGD